MDSAEAKLAIEGFTDTFEIVAPQATEEIDAITIHQKYQLGYWDSLILATAKSADCSFVHSEDLSDGQDYNGIQVVNPFIC